MIPLHHLVLQPAKLAVGGQDEVALLVLEDGRIAAVLSRLDDPCHGKLQGQWFLEVGFGRCARSPKPFPHLADGLRWIADCLGAEVDDKQLLALIEHTVALRAADGSAAPSPL